MAFQVIMPTFGLTEGEATLIQWYKQVGERVAVDEPLFEAENEKANLDVPAPESGVLLQIVVPAGRSVPLQEIVAWIGEPEEQVVLKP